MSLICHFMLKSVFIVGLTRFFCLAFENNYVKTKTNEDILYCQRQEFSPVSLVSGSVRFMCFCDVCSSVVMQSSALQRSDAYYVYNGNSNASAPLMASFVIR